VRTLRGRLDRSRLPGRTWRSAIATAGLITSLALAPGSTPAWATSACPGTLFTNVCLISSSQWIEEDTFARSLHIVGEVRNDGSTNLSEIKVTLMLNTSGGTVTEITMATVQVIGPGELSPFDDWLTPIPPGYQNSFVVAAISSAPSISQPAHSFLDTQIDPCPTGSPVTEVCGHVTNTSTTMTADNVHAILTFDDGAGGHMAQDVIAVDDGTSGATILPGNTSNFWRDRAGEPALPLTGKLAEPDYPIDMNPPSLAFSSRNVGTTSLAEHVTLINNGPRSVNISGIIASGDFRQTNNCGSSVMSLSSCVIDVAFAPTGAGARGGALAITDDAPGSVQAIPLLGTGTLPRAAFSPSALSFAQQGVGSTSPAQTVTLRNAGDGPMTIRSFSIGPDFAQTNACPSVLAPNAQCVITVTFSPSQTGNLVESLTVQDDPVDTPPAVTLTGTATGPSAQLAPGALDFGPQLFGAPSSAKAVTLTNGGIATLTIASITTSGDFSQTNNCGQSITAGNSCAINVSFTPTALGSRSGSLALVDNAGSQSVPLTGLGTGRPAAIYRAVPVLNQYTLAGSDGRTWQDMDSTNLVLTIPASTAPGTAILTANGDLWTEQAGVNQDMAIFVNDQLVAWKESGGFAGTFSPNAAAVQVAYALSPNVTYTVRLKWKTNVATSRRIHAGAGAGPTFSPTTLTAQVVGTLIATQSTSQYTLGGSDGQTWQDMDASQLALTIPSSPVPSTAIISGNADLWTERAGVNQDLAIFIDGLLAGWKESGGFAGTFSPNAALAQVRASLSPNRAHLVELRWKTNVATGGRIHAGAGLGPYSPTTLTVVIAPTDTVTGVQSTDQYRLGGSNGVLWQDIDSTNLVTTIPASSSQTTVVVSGNADLWTERAGVNQDLAIFIDGALAAWKESGGFAGTFSPNAAFVQTVATLAPGIPHTIELRWKTNVPTSGGIRAGAGVGPAFSPSTLTIQLIAG